MSTLKFSAGRAWRGLAAGVRRGVHLVTAAAVVLAGAAIVPGAMAAPTLMEQKFEFTVTLQSQINNFRLPTMGQDLISEGVSRVPFEWEVQYSSDGGAWSPSKFLTGTASHDGAGAVLGNLPPGETKIRLYPAKDGVRVTDPQEVAWGWLRAFSTYNTDPRGANNNNTPAYAYPEVITSVGDIPFRGIAAAVEGGARTAAEMFRGAINLRSVGKVLNPSVDPDWAAVTKVGNFFFQDTFNRTGLKTISGGSFVVDNLTDVGESFFSLTFHQDSQLVSLPTGSFNTSGLTHAPDGFFYGFAAQATALTSLPDGSFNTSLITSADGLVFGSAFTETGLTKLPAGSFVTSSIRDRVGDNFFNSTFAYTPLSQLPPGSFNLAKIKNTGQRFFKSAFQKTNLTSLPDGSFVLSAMREVDPLGFFGQTFTDTPLTGVPAGSFIFNSVTFVPGDLGGGAFAQMFANTQLDLAEVLKIANTWEFPVEDVEDNGNFRSTFFGVPAAGKIGVSFPNGISQLQYLPLGTNSAFAATNLCASDAGLDLWGLIACPTITYFAPDATAGTVPSPVTYGYPTMSVLVSQPGNLDRSGYSFAGWNDLSSGVATLYVPGSTLTLPRTDVALFAAWKANATKIEYMSNGGGGTMDPTPGFTDDSATVSVNGFTRDGYSFTGWNTKDDGSGEPYNSGASVILPSNGLVLYAMWAAGDAALTYDANGGSGSMSGVAGKTGDVVKAAANGFTRDGYSFAGWNTKADGTGTGITPGDDVTIAAGGTTLYAMWAAGDAALTYDANGGSGSMSGVAGKTGDVVKAAANGFTRDGYSFAGWNTKADGTGTGITPGDDVTIAAGGTILYAMWTAGDAALTYDANGGSGSMSGVAGKTGDVVKAAANGFTRDGYSFAGWNTKADGTGTGITPGDDVTIAAGGTILYAMWAAGDAALTYDANGGSGSMSGVAGKTGDVVKAAANGFTRDGYSFAGWNTKADGTGTGITPGDDVTIAAGGTTLYAMWTGLVSGPPSDLEVTDKGASGKGKPGAEIDVTDPKTGESLCKDAPVVVDKDGNWSCEFKKPQAPGTDVEVSQKEKGKLPSEPTPGKVPDRSGPPSDLEVTDKGASGKGKPGAEIDVTDPKTGESLCKDAPVVVDKDGNWSCEFKKPQAPGTDVEVNQKEKGKLPSEPTPGKVPPVSPLDKSEMPTDVVAGEKAVTGKGQSGATIVVTDPVKGENLCKDTPVIVGADGTWSCEFTQSQKPGNGVDVVQQEDGKAPSEKVTVTVQADEVGPLQIVRYSGADRYGTSLDLNSRRLVKGKPVFVATGGNFPDSLSAGPAVTVQGGSLVLSNKGSMKAGMLTHIGNAEPSMVYIIGETGAISKDVEKQLTDKFGALKVKRVGGVDRYATSAMIASEFFKDVDVSMAFVASGVNFPDALTASAVGGALTAPVLLVAGGKNASVLNPGMSGFLSSKGVRELVIAGGEVAVGPKLKEELGKSFTVSRAGGVDRYATNLLVNALLDSKFPDTQLRGVWLAAGANFPDALSAAVPAGKADQRLVLAKKSCVSGTVVDWVVKADSKVDFVGIVGGTAVLASVFENEKTLKDARCPN